MDIRPNTDKKCPGCGAKLCASDEKQKILALDAQGFPIRLALYEPVRQDGKIVRYRRKEDPATGSNVEFDVCPECGLVQFHAVNLGPVVEAGTHTEERTNR